MKIACHEHLNSSHLSASPWNENDSGNAGLVPQMLVLTTTIQQLIYALGIGSFSYRTSRADWLELNAAFDRRGGWLWLMFTEKWCCCLQIPFSPLVDLLCLLFENLNNSLLGSRSGTSQWPCQRTFLDSFRHRHSKHDKKITTTQCM